MKTLYDILEGWVQGVKTKWHPKEGLFTGDDPQYIADYLLKHSKDRGQAMQRLVFYMNRAGKKCPNKTVLNKAKKILSESLLDKDFDIDGKEIFKAELSKLGVRSKEIFELMDACKWAHKDKCIKTSDNIWSDILNYVLEMDYNYNYYKRKQKYVVEVYVYYPNSSSSEKMSAEYMTIMWKGDVYFIGNVRGETCISKNKIHPHTQNYTINYVPDKFVDLIEWFINENS